MDEGISFPVDNFIEFKNKMLNWVKPFNIFCLLDNSRYNFEAPAFECMLAAGSKRRIEARAGKFTDTLKQFCAEGKEWVFGHLGYDLKNETEQLVSMNFDGVGFSDSHFFVPEIVIKLTERTATIYAENNAVVIFAAITKSSSLIQKDLSAKPVIKRRITQDDYIDTIKKLKDHILRGDCYEINFCQEFFANDAVIDPLAVYDSLLMLSPNPFSALYKVNGLYCICASPERYFKKKGTTLYLQPIKGTSKRNLKDPELDRLSRQQLISSQKEKSENVMIVDLVRNDLSKVCKEGTVQVDELFGIYSFPQVHQMISTISGELEEKTDWIDVVKATFPMGSMTGAPKKRVMELIERYEQTKRGLFSGAIGYIDPAADADFNVVIRSILYNSTTKYVSFQAGSAITFYSDPLAEYQECLLKIEAIRTVLEAG